MQFVSIDEMASNPTEKVVFRITVDKPTVDTKYGILMTSVPGTVTVRSLTNTSILRKHGLAMGDTILEVNGTKVDGAILARTLIADAPVGKLVLVAERNGGGLPANEMPLEELTPSAESTASV